MTEAAVLSRAAAQQSTEGLGGDFFAEYNFSTAEASLEGMLQAGVHFGHVKSRRHPRMDEYVYTTRKNISIINLQKTQELLRNAEQFLQDVVKNGKTILFVGMKKQTHSAVKSLATRLGEPYVMDRWLGGTLTNFSCIRKRVQYLEETEAKILSGEFKRYTKFEQVKKQQEVDRLEHRMGGLRKLSGLPGAIVVVDVKDADLVVHEARALAIPIVGIVDTNADPSLVDFPIPGNDDALSSLRFILGRIGRAVVEAKAGAAAKTASVV